jgi:hypothetical protein
MNRCTKCLIPDTRPDTQFVEGVCSACLAFAARPEIDWPRRKRALVDLLDRHHGECIVPSSGGKDSHYQALKLLQMGAHVTVVTASTCHLTPIGRANIDNLKRYAKTIEVSPNQTVRRKLNRLGLELVGDISWPEHVSIFTTPFMMALALGRSLIFYGESPQNQYGGPLCSQDARVMTMRWVSEFGGFLGLRPQDLVGKSGITEKDMNEYLMPDAAELVEEEVEAHFLGQYLPWDSHYNAEVALAQGMSQQKPVLHNWWDHENLDNAQTGLHDASMFRKYGYGRGCAQISCDIRSGRVARENALAWVNENDWRFPIVYGGVHYREVLERLGMSSKQLELALDGFTNWKLFEDGSLHRPEGAF